MGKTYLLRSQVLLIWSCGIILVPGFLTRSCSVSPWKNSSYEVMNSVHLFSNRCRLSLLLPWLEFFKDLDHMARRMRTTFLDTKLVNHSLTRFSFRMIGGLFQRYLSLTCIIFCRIRNLSLVWFYQLLKTQALTSSRAASHCSSCSEISELLLSSHC
ncbi:hypothetical protein DL96DRAFT_864994 [Flagelloscypha sp. PMI_526]|nr:hypothetical protein DL96DRAFT_864994 [Flagelloscypha sp. PMI_526]